MGGGLAVRWWREPPAGVVAMGGVRSRAGSSCAAKVSGWWVGGGGGWADGWSRWLPEVELRWADHLRQRGSGGLRR